MLRGPAAGGGTCLLLIRPSVCQTSMLLGVGGSSSWGTCLGQNPKHGGQPLVPSPYGGFSTSFVSYHSFGRSGCPAGSGWALSAALRSPGLADVVHLLGAGGLRAVRVTVPRQVGFSVRRGWACRVARSWGPRWQLFNGYFPCSAHIFQVGSPTA